MDGMTRRGLVAGMAAMAAGKAVGQGAAASQIAAASQLAAAEPHAQAGDFAQGSKVFSLSRVTPTKLPNGGERLSGFMGTLATGETAGMHESWMPAGTPAPALHRIVHSEMIAVLEGELEFEHDGSKELAVAGDVIYVAYGTTHAIRNAGKGTARYMVFQVGNP
jgi:mannose-6-phosphate isomerase-like protein (cupin superfamily)